MVCHCIGNERVLLAFVHQGCITFAKDILIGEHPRMVSGSQPCLSLAKNVRSDAVGVSRTVLCAQPGWREFAAVMSTPRG